MTGTPRLYLSLVLVAAMTRPGEAKELPVKLDVTVTGAPSQTINVSCTFDPVLASMNEVEDLRIYGAKPNGKKNDFQPLVSVDRWNKNPHIFHGLGVDDVDVSAVFGFETQKTELNISWVSPTQLLVHHYKCAAEGIDHKGGMVTISDSAVVDIKTLQDDSLAIKVDLLSEKVDDLAMFAGHMAKGLLEIKGRVEEIEKAINTNAGEAESRFSYLEDALDNNVKTSSDTMQAFSSATSEMSNHISILEEKVVDIEKEVTGHKKGIALVSAQEDFEVSEIYKDRVYLAKKKEDHFDFAAADSRCQTHGGYLVEVNDQDEFDFVMQFLHSVVTYDMYFTGATDKDDEGSFTFYHSGETMPDDFWAPGQPKSFKTDEDCVKIDLYEDAMQAISCDNYKVKYVCEVPL